MTGLEGTLEGIVLSKALHCLNCFDDLQHDALANTTLQVRPWSTHGHSHTKAPLLSQPPWPPQPYSCAPRQWEHTTTDGSNSSDYPMTGEHGLSSAFSYPASHRLTSGSAAAG